VTTDTCIKETKDLSVFEKYLTAWVLLIEVPVLLMPVRICLRAVRWFK
jgi:ACR3 family arsenite efflux pump ArsB